MDFLAGIGFIVIVLLGIYGFGHYMTDPQDFVRNNSKLIDCSEKCQKLIFKFDREISSGKSTMTESQFYRQLRQILRDPVELKKAQEKLSEKEAIEAKIKMDFRNKRKVGYKYEIDIFEIFGIKKKLSSKELTEKIRNKYHVDENGAMIILNIWDDHDLISKDYDQREMWMVGSILVGEAFKIDPSDITRGEWLTSQGLKLESK